MVLKAMTSLVVALHVSVLNLLEQGGTKKRNTEYVEKVKTTPTLEMTLQEKGFCIQERREITQSVR
jgi:hypothetical protein